MTVPDEAVEAAHAAICEENLDDCLEWRGRCVKAVAAAALSIGAKAWDDGWDAGASGPSKDHNPYRSQDD